MLLYLIGLKAQTLFTTLKKKYARKKKELKASDRSGTSTEAVAKAQKAFQPYEFLNWLDGFMQTRQGRSNLPVKSQSTEEDLFFEDEESTELSPAMVTPNEENQFDDALNVTEQEEQPTVVENAGKKQRPGIKVAARENLTDDMDQEQRKVVNTAGKKKRPGIKGAARENLMEDMEFSLIRTLQEKVSNKRKAEDTIKDESNEDLF